MNVALFVPCYINELYPEVARDTLLILRNFKINVKVPRNQTCCGQPFINSGVDTTLPDRFDEIFEGFDYVVAPSSSCTSTLREKGKKVYELVEFLRDVMDLKDLAKNYPPIILHNSCHSIRSLELATPSEINRPYFNKVKELLGCEIYEAKSDECCGFGGVFSLKEGELSYIMGKEKLEDLLDNPSKIVTGVDMSCLMHLEAIAKKEGIEAQFKHISKIIKESL